MITSKSTSLSGVGVPYAYDPKRMIFSGLSSSAIHFTAFGNVCATGGKPTGWIFLGRRNLFNIGILIIPAFSFSPFQAIAGLLSGK